LQRLSELRKAAADADLQRLIEQRAAVEVHNDAILSKYQEQIAWWQSVGQGAYQTLASGLTGGISVMFESLGMTIASALDDSLSRGQSALAILGQLAGSILSTIGTMLIQLGSAAVLAGTLGTIVPFLAPATGGPAGVVAGLAAIAGGGALVAAGAALGAVSRPRGTSSAPASRVASGRGTVGSVPDYRAGSATSVASGGSNVQVFNLSFSNVLPGSERQIAQEIRRVLAT